VHGGYLEVFLSDMENKLLKIVQKSTDKKNPLSYLSAEFTVV
jgi:hypothetical protein